MQTVRVSALNNRVPSAVGLGLLALYLAILSRGVVTVIIAAAFVSMLLLVTFDLDRPTTRLRDRARHAPRCATGVHGAPAGGRGAGRPLTYSALLSLADPEAVDHRHERDEIHLADNRLARGEQPAEVGCRREIPVSDRRDRDQAEIHERRRRVQGGAVEEGLRLDAVDEEDPPA